MQDVVLRIHLSSEDLARVRVARTPDPLWESVLSLRVLGSRRAHARFETWRRHTLGRLTPLTRTLCELVTAPEHWPDFLTPTRGDISAESAVGHLMDVPPERMRTELRDAGIATALTTALTGGHRTASRRLGQAMLSYFSVGIAPYWLRIHAAADGARATMARTLVDDGIERMLLGLWPGASWRPPVLELPYCCDKDLVPAGREVVLLPSFFSLQAPLTRRDPALPPVLVFSVRDACQGATLDPAPGTAGAQRAVDAKLAALLGRTRAAVLEAAATACTTTELARRVGISLASASQHATVLREAGLLSTVRHRNAVVHTATALGAALLSR